MSMPLSIDLDSHPNLRLRIDSFEVPVDARAEFDAATQRSLDFIKTVPGSLGTWVFEKISGPSTFNVVTIAVWKDQDAIDSAGKAVRAYYQSIGFEPAELISRLGVRAELGAYRAGR